GALAPVDGSLPFPALHRARRQTQHGAGRLLARTLLPRFANQGQCLPPFLCRNQSSSRSPRHEVTPSGKPKFEYLKNKRSSVLQNKADSNAIIAGSVWSDRWAI